MFVCFCCCFCFLCFLFSFIYLFFIVNKSDCSFVSAFSKWHAVLVWLSLFCVCSSWFRGLVCSLWSWHYLAFSGHRDIWASAWDFQQCRMCDQQSRIRAVWSEPLLVAWVFYDCKAADWTPFGVSKLKRRLQMLVLVYTYQNTTLLEISCTGSYSSQSWHIGTTVITCSCGISIIFSWNYSYRLMVTPSFFTSSDILMISNLWYDLQIASMRTCL